MRKRNDGAAGPGPGALEADLAALAPLVREGFASAEPSPGVLARIHEEAVRQAARQAAWRRGFRRFVRIAALAASLALLAGGVFLFRPAGPGGRGGVADAGAPAPAADEAAELLLAMQGLDADGYFDSDASESAWL